MPDLERDIDTDEIGISDDERTKRRKVMEKTTGKDLQKKWTQEDRFEIEMREKALAPPTITEPRCSVCTSEYRVYIERQVVKGSTSLAAIARSVPPDADGKTIDRRAISNHSKNHMPINDAVIRAMLEEEADLLKQNYEEGIKGALTNRGILKVIISKAYEDVLNGVTTAEVRDIIQMVKLINEMENNAGQIKSDEAETSLRIFVRAVQNVCDTEMKTLIASEVKRLRQMDEVEFAMEGHLELPAPTNTEIEADVVESEIVDN